MSAPKAEDPWMFRLALNHLRASDLQLRHPWKEKLRCKVLVERGDSGAGKDKDVHDKAFKSEWQTVGGADVHWRFQMETQLPIFMNSVSAPRVVDWLQRHHIVISLYCNHGSSSSGSDKSASASSVKKKASYGSVKLPLFDCVTGAINHNMPLLDDAGKTMGRLAFALEAEQVAKVSVHFKRVQLTGLQPVANAGATGLNPYLKYSFSKYWPLVESRKMKAVYSTIQTKTVDPEWVDLPVLTFHTTMREMLKHSIVVHCTHDGGKFAHTTVARANLLFKTLIEGRAKGFSANDEITFKGPLKSGDATIEGSLKLSGLPIFAQCVGGHLSQPLRTEDGLVDARPILPWIMPPRLRMKRSDEDDDEDDSTAAGADAAAGAAAATAAAGTDSAPGTPGSRKPRRHMDAEDATHALQRALSASARSQRTETSTSAIRGSHHHHHHHHRDGKTTPPPSGGGGGAAAAARGAAGGDLSDTVTTSGSPITVRKPKKSAINKSDSATGLARSAGGDDAGDEEQDAEEAARAEARAVAAAEAAGIPPLRPPPQATTSRVAPTRTRSRSFASAQPPPQTLSAQADASAFVDDLISLASPAKPPTHSARAAIAADAHAAGAAAAAAANAEDDPAAARAAYEDQLLAEIAQRTGIAELMAADAKQRTEARLDAPLVPEEDAAAAAGGGGAGAAARTPSPGAEGMPDPFADVVLGAGVGDSTVATSVTGDKAPTFDPYGVFSAPAAAPPAAAPAVAAGGVATNNPFASSTEFNPFA